MLLALRRLRFPYNSEDLIGIIRGNGRLGIFAFELELDKLGLLLSGSVQGEPVVEIFRTYAPAVLHSLRTVKRNRLDFCKHIVFEVAKGK